MERMIKMKPKVSIIILNWNGKQLTLNCAKSALKNDYKNFEVIVVDNGSTDGSVEALRKIKGITVVSLKENYGFSKGMNMGAWHALRGRPDYLAFANNDTLFTQKNWLSELVQDLENDSTAAIATSRFTQNGKIIYAGANYGARMRNAISHRVPVAEPDKKQYVTSNYAALVLVKTEAISKIGLWDERFTPFWHEDHDFDKRILKAGYKIIYEPKVTLQHGGSKTLSVIEKKSGKQTMIDIERKNCIRFVCKHFRFPLSLIAACYKLSQTFIERKGWKLSIHNPLKAVKLFNKVDLRREKVWLTDEEARDRIKDIFKT
jgi:GT2 family glycosyltransferase